MSELKSQLSYHCDGQQFGKVRKTYKGMLKKQKISFINRILIEQRENKTPRKTIKTQSKNT